MVRLSTINKAFNAFVKVLLNRNDPKEVQYCFPPGLESKPIKGEKGLIVGTDSGKINVIVGVLYEGVKTEEGERRLFAVDNDGNDLGEIYLNKSGECVINEGDDYATMFNKLNLAIQEFNAKLTAEQGLIASGIATGGGLYTPTNLSIDISEAKAEKVRI